MRERERESNKFVAQSEYCKQNKRIISIVVSLGPPSFSSSTFRFFSAKIEKKQNGYGEGMWYVKFMYVMQCTTDCWSRCVWGILPPGACNARGSFSGFGLVCCIGLGLAFWRWG